MLRALSLPLDIIKSPGRFLSGIWQDGGRGQFLVMGIPAVLVAGIVILAGIMAYSNDADLRADYQGLAQEARENANSLQKELFAETGSKNLDSVSDSDERKQALALEINKEQMFLKKLIDLDKDNPEHKFQLAMLAFRQRNIQLGESLLEVIAPFDEPGYADAHVALANIYMRRAAASRSQEQKLLDLKRADKQASNAMIADASNLQAKQIKASLLTMKQSYIPAYNLFEELFESNPIYYRQLVKLSRILRDKQKENKVLDRAAAKYREQVKTDLENVSDWVAAWENYIICLKLLGQFDSAETELKGELRKLAADGGDVGKEVFLKKELSRVYSERVVNTGRSDDPKVQEKQLNDLKNSLENDRKNEVAMQWLTILGLSEHVGEAARKIYDPQYDPNTPWEVLSELGNAALTEENYETAIKYFERARKKKPNNPMLLNNLAYAYLVAPEAANPEQALLLVDQALLNVRNLELGNRDDIVSSFFDTRGEALMQLDRMEDAAASLEIAFRARPGSRDILEKLLECYQATGNDLQAEQIRRRLEKLRSEE